MFSSTFPPAKNHHNYNNNNNNNNQTFETVALDDFLQQQSTSSDSSSSTTTIKRKIIISNQNPQKAFLKLPTNFTIQGQQQSFQPSCATPQVVVNSLDELFNDERINSQSAASSIDKVLLHNNATHSTSLLATNNIPSSHYSNNNNNNNHINNASHKITGKRSSSSSHLLSEQNFPPMPKASSSQQLSSLSGQQQQQQPQKKFQSNNSTNNLQQQSSQQQFPPYPIASNQSLTSFLALNNFQPKFLPENLKPTCYVSTHLRLDDILKQVELTLNDLNHQTNHQRCHYEYNNLEFSWNIFFMKSANHSQFKLQLYRLRECDIAYGGGNSIGSEYAACSSSTSLSSSSCKRFLLYLHYEDGDKSLFYHIFHLLKDGIIQYEEGSPNEVSQFLSAVSLSEKISTSTKDNISMKMTSGSSKGIPIYPTPQTASLQTERNTPTLNSSFYENSKNRAILLKWKSDLLQFDYPVIQLEAIKNFLNLCHSSLSLQDMKMFSILEEIELIPALLYFFSADTNGSSMMNNRLMNHDEEIWMKPYIIQILKCFVDLLNTRSLDLISADNGLVQYLAQVSQVKNQSKLKLMKDDCDYLCNAILARRAYTEEALISTDFYLQIPSLPPHTPHGSVHHNPAVNMDFFSPRNLMKGKC